MAGPNDFTGQNIQDTYQRVLQISSSGQITDGTGSLVSISANTATTASYALFAVSASHEITFEISSSHAINADTASFAIGYVKNTQTGSFVTNPQTASFAITGSDVIFRDITASDISASGNITADQIKAASFRALDSSLIAYMPTSTIVFGNDSDPIKIDGNGLDISTGAITTDDTFTSTNYISSSGNIIANNLIGTIDGGKF